MINIIYKLTNLYLNIINKKQSLCKIIKKGHLLSQNLKKSSFKTNPQEYTRVNLTNTTKIFS